MAAAVQASAAALLDLGVGSVIRAILEANAAAALWLQWLILQVLALTRASTSTGADLDTWMADFTLTRLPAVTATGSVTFGRFTLSNTFIPVGAAVKTFDGAHIFNVIADTANPAWAASLNSYRLPAGVETVTVAVRAATAGSASNTQPDTVTLLASSIPGVDTVTNALAFTNGVDAEPDAALRNRFALFLATRSRATQLAVEFAVESVQQGLSFSIAENATPNGTFTPGTFTVAVDDGSGATGAALLDAIRAAVEAVRPIGSRAIVVAATPMLADIQMTLVCATTTRHTTAAGLVVQAIEQYIAALPVGSDLPFTVLAKLAYDASPFVLNVTALLLNGDTDDLLATPSQVIRVGSITIG